VLDDIPEIDRPAPKVGVHPALVGEDLHFRRHPSTLVLAKLPDGLTVGRVGTTSKVALYDGHRAATILSP
jgi:hypothetical protein